MKKKQPNQLFKDEQKLLSAEESAQKDEKKQPNQLLKDEQKLLSAEESAQKDEKKNPYQQKLPSSEAIPQKIKNKHTKIT